MSAVAPAASTTVDIHRLGHHGSETSPADLGPAPKRIVVGYGFWLFLLSDFVMFAGLFAAFAVLAGATDGGPSGRDIFNTNTVAIETACLLVSSFFCGMASLAVVSRSQLWTQSLLIVTGLFGVSFVALEVMEFSELLARGAGPQRSAFLSSFFTLVGCHGLHVTAGLIWLGTMMAQIFAKGFTPPMLRRFQCFTLFWHALDIIWIAVFTLVYLMGVA